MSSDCKILKVMSLIMAVLGIAQIALGAIMFFGAGAAAGVEGVENPVLTAQVGGILFIISGAFYFITAALGIGGANKPAKIGGAYFVFAAIVVLMNAAEAVLTVMGGSGNIYLYIVIIAVALVGIVCASKARKAAQDRLA